MITTLTGTNSFALRTRLQQLINTFTQTYGAFGLERLDAEELDYQRLLDSVQTLPFLAEKRMVVIESPAANKQLAEHLDDLLAAVNEVIDVVFVEPVFDKRSSMYKKLQKATQFEQFDEQQGGGLITWLAKEASSQGGTLSASDARYLVDRVGTSQTKLANEIAKLVSFSPTITRQSIELLTLQTPTSSTFDLLDAAFAGNQQKTIKLYDEQRAQKVEPQAILALLAWQLHVLAVIKSAKVSERDIAKHAKINPYVVQKSMRLASRISLTALKAIIAQTLQLDMQLKREAISADAALKNLLLSIKSATA